MESQLPGLPVLKLKPESGHGSEKILHRTHILPIGWEVQLPDRREVPEMNKEPPKRRRVSRRLKAKRKENYDTPCLPAPEQDDKMEVASDSEDDEMGVWHDYYVPRELLGLEPQNIDHCEPFNMDLDLAVLTSNSEMDETAEEPAAVEEDDHLVQNVTAEIVKRGRDTEIQTSDEIAERLNGITESPDMTTRPQRLKKAPTRLTYDFLGTPKSVAVGTHSATVVEISDKKDSLALSPIKKYKSLFYKWIG